MILRNWRRKNKNNNTTDTLC